MKIIRVADINPFMHFKYPSLFQKIYECLIRIVSLINSRLVQGGNCHDLTDVIKLRNVVNQRKSQGKGVLDNKGASFINCSYLFAPTPTAGVEEVSFI